MNTYKQDLSTAEAKVKQKKSILINYELITDFKCVHCDTISETNTISVISDYWYETPHGCMGGDHWSSSNDYEIVCPNCNQSTRGYESNWDLSTKFGNTDNFRMYSYITRNMSKFKEVLINCGYEYKNLDELRKLQ